MTPADLDRVAKLAGIPIPKETPVPDADLAKAARIAAALRRVVGAHQPEAVDVDGPCDRYGDEPGSGCCGACDLTTTTTVCTCGAGLDLLPCPTLAVIGDELGVVLDGDAPPDSLAGLLREHLAPVSDLPAAARRAGPAAEVDR